MSRELTELQKAKDALLASHVCRAGINAQNATQCASLSCESLMRFKNGWDLQNSNFKNRSQSTNRFRIIFGNDKFAPGLLPALTFAAYCGLVGWLVKTTFFPDKVKGVAPKRGPNWIQWFMIYFFGLTIAMTIFVTLSWTVGVVVKHEQSGINDSLLHDSNLLSGSQETTVPQSSEFAKIWRACGSSALLQVYNCRMGRDQLEGIDQRNVEDLVRPIDLATGNRPPTKIELKCNAVTSLPDPKGTNPSLDPLWKGLEALRTLDVAAYDAPALVQQIHAGVVALKGYLTPQGTFTKRMTQDAIDAVIKNEIIPVLVRPEFVPAPGASTEDREKKLRAFIDAVDSTFSPAIATILTKYWPRVNPEMQMDLVDAQMIAAYKDELYYTDHLRSFVVTAFRTARASVIKGLKDYDARYATASQFVNVNWPQVIVPHGVAVRKKIEDLQKAVVAYTQTFAPQVNDRPVTLAKELENMYLTATMIVVCLGTICFLIYYVFIRNVHLFAVIKDFKNDKEAGTYASLDVAKYCISIVGVLMFVMAALNAVKTKRKFIAEHNKDAIYYNTLRFKASCDALAQPATLSNPDAFYRTAMAALEAYGSCNFIVGASKVPFPVVEMVIYGIFLMFCVASIGYLVLMALPAQRVKELRDMFRLRGKIQLFSSGLPTGLTQEVNSRFGCMVYRDQALMRILSFVFVIIMFLLGIILVDNFRTSADKFRNTLNVLASDVCV
jgi:hypothetical protein